MGRGHFPGGRWVEGATAWERGHGMCGRRYLKERSGQVILLEDRLMTTGHQQGADDEEMALPRRGGWTEGTL